MEGLFCRCSPTSQRSSESKQNPVRNSGKIWLGLLSAGLWKVWRHLFYYEGWKAQSLSGLKYNFMCMASNTFQDCKCGCNFGTQYNWPFSPCWRLVQPKGEMRFGTESVHFNYTPGLYWSWHFQKSVEVYLCCAECSFHCFIRWFLKKEMLRPNNVVMDKWWSVRWDSLIFEVEKTLIFSSCWKKADIEKLKTYPLASLGFYSWHKLSPPIWIQVTLTKTTQNWPDIFPWFQRYLGQTYFYLCFFLFLLIWLCKH